MMKLCKNWSVNCTQPGQIVWRYQLAWLYNDESSGLVEWLKCQSSNLRIANCMSSNPVRGKPLFL